MLVLCGLLFYIGKLIIKKIEEICRKRVWFDRNANYIKFLAGFICTALAPSLSRQLSFKLSELSSFFHQEEVVSKQEQNDISFREFCLPFPKGLNSVKNLSEVLAWKRINMSCSGVRQHPYKGLDNRNEEKRSRISTLLFDALAGLLFYMFILNISPPDLLSSYFIQWRDETHQFLNNLLDWLMGAPAGLKLNQEMTVFFGNFFIYHVYIWIGYLSILEPYYNYIIMAIIYSSLLGFSVMLSLANDTLRALSFHTYCFYVYAAKVYKLQLQALISLSRLMRGKKWNPLRTRVDSIPYDPSQLAFGTIIFTILLFLLPTTCIYYLVFTLLRLPVIILKTVTYCSIKILNTIPAYEILERIFMSNGNRDEPSLNLCYGSPLECQSKPFIRRYRDAAFINLTNEVSLSVKFYNMSIQKLLLRKIDFGFQNMSTFNVILKSLLLGELVDIIKIE